MERRREPRGRERWKGGEGRGKAGGNGREERRCRKIDNVLR